jgi:hypothetical protein
MLDLKDFQNPDSILRPAPFWAINEHITPEETARQIEDMISVGLSGGFFHSRAGLITDYLGDEWFAAMEAALKVAREKNGYLWLYDEDLWPSGNAGGQVAGMADEYRATTLNAHLVPKDEPAPQVAEDQILRFCYAIKARNGLFLEEFEIVPLDQIDSFLKYERLFLVRAYAQKTGWWGGESYANLLHPDAMRQFIRLTHDVYAKKLGEEFGKRIPGIFTDEPQLLCGYNQIAWYEGIPEAYTQWTSRSFWNDLPYMFFEGPEARKIRLLIHRTILRQFLEAFSKPIYEWCERHGIEHTGHYMQEDSFEAQIGSHYGGVMAHYRYQHAPGIDHLCRHVEGLLLTCRQVSSAARQLGRKRVLTEIFGVTRHTNTFEDFKWLGDYNLVHGANFFVPHLTWYSAKGRRKRDYPPVWNYQQTYWKELNPLNDYFTRVAYALTSGKAKVDVLLLHSIESATAAHRFGVKVDSKISDMAHKVPVDIPTEDMSAARYFDNQMRKALDAILTAGYECDLGDENYIEDMGRVEGDNFIVGEMSYKVVVVPPSTTWRPKTFELLKQFAKNGGKLVILGEVPSEIDCEYAQAQWKELLLCDNVLSLPNSIREIQEAMDRFVPATFRLKGSDGKSVPLTYVAHRVDNDQDIIFITNSDRNNTRDYVLTVLDGRDKIVTKWDPIEGTRVKIDPNRTSSGEIRLEFSLPACGSILLTLEPDKTNTQQQSMIDETPAKALGYIRQQVKTIPLATELEFKRLDPNVLVLDRISASLDGGKTWWDEDLEHRVRRRIAEHFGTQAALEWQPWVSLRKGVFEGKGGDIVLRYRFTSDIENPKSWMVIEEIWKGKLFVNGTQVDITNHDWHWDKAFGKVEVTDLVRKGENIVDFSVKYDFLTEVEAAYVIGEFGVDLADPSRGKIVDEPQKLKIGSWTDQGYPFYSGRMVYKARFEAIEKTQTLLRLLNPSGTLYKVRLNGADAGRIMWRPFELDITSYVKPGMNDLEIEVVSSLQNTWGPLHNKEGDDFHWVGPEAFENDLFLREEFSIFPYGLLGGAEIAFL